MDSVYIWAGIFFCLSQSAMLSGLNLACFSVSRLQLEIDASDNKKDAIKVLALRKDSNFLLTTILWGNVGVNTLLALLSGSVLSGIVAFLFSTIFITIFAEIIPQSYFSRNAVRVAALLSPALRFYQLVLYPVAKPTAKVLDWWLGPDGVHYLRETMLREYIVKSMRSGGSDIDPFEGRGAVNFLALDSRLVGESGQLLDPDSIVSLPQVDGRPEIPEFGHSHFDDFSQRVQVSGKKWAVLTDPEGTPRLLLNVDQFARAVLAATAVDPYRYCVTPVVTNDPQTTLEQALLNTNSSSSNAYQNGLILLWGTEKRIIVHADLLRGLFDGVLSGEGGLRRPARVRG